ncbi:MAG: mitochondrial Homoaconitase [Geoglossum umbratile]|nr:MAG: mitochondrial Homoaconitase [Geoglossum umbratile]
MGATRVKDPRQLVFALDHDVQDKSESNLKKYEQIEAFAKKQKVEKLFVWPGKLCVASDSHSNMYGGVSSLGTAVVRTDAASIWATGKSWYQVPPVAHLTFTGTLPPGVTGKDVIVALCGLFKSDVLNHAVEFKGSDETLASISVDNRLTISNIFPIDRTLEHWLRYKATEATMFKNRTTQERWTHEKIDKLYADPVQADPGAYYAKKLYLNLSTLSPYVSAAKVFQDAAKANGGKIPKIAEGVKLYIAAASVREQKIAEDEGSWQTLLEAANYSGVDFGYGTGSPVTTESKLGNVLEQLESLIDRVESSVVDDTSKTTTKILPGFPEKISEEGMASVCMSNYDPDFGIVVKPNDILVSGFNFGCGSSREQAVTAILAKKIPLVVAGSFGNIFSRNSINNVLLGLEIPRLIERLRAMFTSSDKLPTRRTGWTLTWDVARGVVKVQEGENGDHWEEKVGEFAENLQEIVAKGGLENWIKHEIMKTEA